MTARSRLKYGSENWILNSKIKSKLQAAQIRFLCPQLGLTKMDTDIRDKLKVQNIVEENSETIKGIGYNMYKE